MELPGTAVTAVGHTQGRLRFRQGPRAVSNCAAVVKCDMRAEDILIVHGNDDAVVPLKHSQLLRDAYPKLSLQTVNDTHGLSKFTQEELNDTVKRCLKVKRS